MLFGVTHERVPGILFRRGRYYRLGLNNLRQLTVADTDSQPLGRQHPARFDVD